MKFSAMAEDYTIGTMLAKSVIAELEVAKDLKLGKKEGDFGEEFDRFRWVTEIKEDNKLPMYTVKVTVYFKRTVEEREIELNTILLKPTE